MSIRVALVVGVVAVSGCKKDEAPVPAGPAPVSPAAPAAPAATVQPASPAASTEQAAAAAPTCGGAEMKADGQCGSVEAAKPAAPAAPGTGTAGDPAAAAGTPPAAGSPAAAPQHLGAPFELTSAIPLAAALDKAEEYNGKTVRVTATIDKVCKKKGCWFVLTAGGGDTRSVRVTMKDYGFFVPTDSEGRKVDVEGTLRSVTVPEAQRKHLAEDGGQDPSKVTGSTVELTLVASAIDLGT